ncbi:MAG TPA: flippase [Mucilaginibacter sp.]|jgi:O-antigen/teichoic acid export membrane protein
MKKNYLFNLLLSVANILFPIITFPYVSKMLGPVGIGKVQFITTFASYFALIAALGIPIYGVREIAKHKSSTVELSKVFSELVIINFITSIFLSVIYVAVILFLPWFNEDKNLYLWAIMLIFLGFSSIDWFYAGLEEFKTVAVRSVLVRMVSLALMFLLIRKDTDYYLYLMILIFVTLANNLINVLMLSKRVTFTYKNLLLQRHLRPLFLIFGTTVATSMYTMLDTVLLGFLSDNKSVGLYSAAVKLSKIAIPIVTSLGVILVPKISKSLDDKNTSEVQSLLNKSFSFIAFISIPLGFGLAILAPELIIAFSSNKFIDGIFSMQILSLLPFLIGFGYFFGFQILIPGGRDKELLFSVLGGVIVGLLLNFLLVPQLKQLGAAIANVGSELVVTLLYMYFARKHYKYKFYMKPIYAAILCSLLFIPIVFTLRVFNLNLYVFIFLSIAICGIVYFFAQKLLFKNNLITETIQPFLLNKLPFYNKRTINQEIDF